MHFLLVLLPFHFMFDVVKGLLELGQAFAQVSRSIPSLTCSTYNTKVVVKGSSFIRNDCEGGQARNLILRRRDVAHYSTLDLISLQKFQTEFREFRVANSKEGCSVTGRLVAT